MKHTLGHRSAASAVAFLGADSEADKEGLTVTAGPKLYSGNHLADIL